MNDQRLTIMGIEPKEIPEDRPLMARKVAEVEADRAGLLRAMTLDVKLQDAFLQLMRESNGTYLVAYQDRVELNADGVFLFARSCGLCIEELPEHSKIIDKYIGEKSGRQEWVMSVAVRVTDPVSGRTVVSVESCSSEDQIHSYKERMADTGEMVAQRSYGERYQMVHAHAATRAAKDAIDKLVGFPSLTTALCEQLGLKFQGVSFGKGKFGGKKEPAKPAPEKTTEPEEIPF